MTAIYVIMERDAKKLSWKTGVSPFQKGATRASRKNTNPLFWASNNILLEKCWQQFAYIYAYNVCIYVVVWQSFSHPVEKDAQVKIMIFIISPGINMTQIVETRKHHLEE